MAGVEPPKDWWGKSLAVLSLDFFQRALSAMKSKGLKQETVSKILINYAQSSLQGLTLRDMQSSKGGFSDADMLKQQKIVVETIVALLPSQSRRSPVPMAFLSGLLKTATMVSASTICRADLERRIGLQLDQAILEDVLIPAANAHGGCQSSLYDTESVARIFSIFLNLEEDEEDGGRLREERDGCYELDSPRSPKQSAIVKVSKLLDSYLAEVALDSNLTPSKFIALAELLPDHARVVNDGLYRAVDIFLKVGTFLFLIFHSIADHAREVEASLIMTDRIKSQVHPNIKDSERYRLCKTIDCQKLSQEACSHAAQNERLPIQMAVQVLYLEQIRLRNVINGGHDQFFFGSAIGQCAQRSGSGVGSGAISPRDNYASVRRENRELKLEVARMRIRLTDLEKDHVSMKQELVRANPANKLLRSFTKNLSKLSALFRMRVDVKPLSAKAASDARLLFQKRRRQAIW